MDKVVRKVVLDVGTRVVELSPVGDGDLWKHPPPKGYVGGRFRANWQYGAYGSVGIPMNTVGGVDPTGGQTIAGFTAKIGTAPTATVHVFLNNLPYAQRLEDGWSTQAPAGMVGITTREFQSFVRRAASLVK